MGASTKPTSLIAGLQARWRRTERDIRRRLTWSRIYRFVSYARSALWIVPFVAIIGVLVTVPVLRAIDRWIQWDLVALGVDGAKSLYQTVITLTLSFLVFTFGSLLVAIQIAGGQLTPRIIATTLLRDNVVRYSVGLFVYALLFAVMALDRIEDRVHELVTVLTIVLGLVTVTVFLFLIDYAARLLRPVSILARVGQGGLRVIDAVYPRLAAEADAVSSRDGLPDTPRRVVPHAGRSEIVLALDIDTLMREARRARGAIEFVPHVGDFVAADEPLFVLYGGAVDVDDQILRTTVAFGPERTMEQDPLFSFRIMADIALKALSPAINDPTTGVLAIDQIHRLLRSVGGRRLKGDVLRDGLGAPRVVYHTPDWEDFVHIACTEIRHCGANNVQVARRLRAMLENLIVSLPAHRRAALEAERDRLDLAIRAAYPIPADLALAAVPDAQGLGGSTGTRARA
jgi:uncharacterized membrane protein